MTAQRITPPTPKRKFAVFDIDGTLIRGGLYRSLVLGLVEKGAVAEPHAAEIRQKLALWKRRETAQAYDDYELSLVKAIDHSLTNISPKLFDAVAQEIIDQEIDHVYTYTRRQLRLLKQRGYFLAAISGSQQELVEPFAKKYGFDDWVAQRYLRDGDSFTGEIIRTYTGKDKILQRIIDQHNLTLTGSYAFGDSQGDRHMLDMVEHPVAFNPTEELLQLAMERGWPVVVERKSVVFELEKGEDDGYLLARAGKI